MTDVKGTDLQSNGHSKSAIGTYKWISLFEIQWSVTKFMRLLAAGYDDILGIIGPFGLWQKRTTAFLWVIIAFIGIPFLVYSFALAKPGIPFTNFTFSKHYSLSEEFTANRVSMSRSGMR